MNKKSKYKPHKRIFLVVADNTSEMHQALYYAARRAATANGEVALFRCVEPLEGQLWGGVSNIMENEAEQESKKLLIELSSYCEKLGTTKPKTYLKKGNTSDELIKLNKNTLFRKTLSLPSNVSTGMYNVKILHYRKGNLISQEESKIKIDKTGISANIYNIAQNFSAIYGIIAVIVALFFGWFTNFIFRRI